jgi:molybdopterin molybdotransferase
MDCDCNTKTSMMELNDALVRLNALIIPLERTEVVAAQQALGRILSQPITAPINVPGYANSAMDGYAYAHGSVECSKPLEIEFTVHAGNTQLYTLSPGKCAAIMTGAPVPMSVDTVVMQESVTRNGDHIVIHTPPTQGANIRPAGNDIQLGQSVAQVGEVITPSHIGLFASLGLTTVETYKPVTVGVFSNGDELKQGGEQLEFGQIFDSNRSALIAMLSKLPVIIKDLGVIRDDLDAIRQVVSQADIDCDLILTSGGASVGEADFTKQVLDELGQVDFWKLAIKPGKPVAFGQLKHAFFFGLPGNPVAASVTFAQLVVPALRKLGGGQTQPPFRFNATSKSALKKRPGRLDFQRGIAEVDESGHWVVRSAGSQGSDVFSAMTKANCFIVLELERGAVSEGETVTVELFTPPLV